MKEQRLCELWNEVEHLDDLARRRLPANHAVHAAMRAALDCPEDEFPDMAKLEAAKDAFYGMNPLILQVTLAGWHPQWLREERKALMDQVRDTIGVIRVLNVIPGVRPIACQSFELADDRAPVRVQIREGASLMEALGGLEQALVMIREQWHTLINERARTEKVGGELMGRKPRRERKKKGDTDSKRLVPKLGGVRNTKAMEPAVA